MEEGLNELSVGAGQAPAEKTLTQSEVNAIVAREKQQAAARAKQEAMMEMQQQQAQYAQQQQSQQAQQNEPYMSREADTDAIYQQIQERFNQEMQQRKFQEDMTNVANSYHSKMSQAKQAKLYDDFEDVTGGFEAAAFPQLVYLAAGMDNTADIMYELAKNATKLTTLAALAERSPQMAQAEMQRMSASISANKQAQQDANASPTNAPLDHLQPSRVSGSNGQMSVRDFRSRPEFRG